VRKAIGFIGRSLITVGLLILLFVAYQLPTTPDTVAPTTTTTVPLLAPEIPEEGKPVAIIRIPKIGVDEVVIEGTTVADLRIGPGHYVETPLPGQVGNAGIAGHRTTYGAPFGDLDQLTTGDEITVQTLTGNWRYELMEEPFEVTPDKVEVLLPRFEKNPTTGVDEPMTTLTLTTCHPRYSAAKRLIVVAKLAPAQEPLPAPPQPPRAERITFGLTGERESRTPTVIWGIVTAVVGLLWWWWFHRHPRWTTWFTGLVPFAIALVGFYYFLERVLPNNY
jgi:sortase A